MAIFPVGPVMPVAKILTDDLPKYTVPVNKDGKNGAMPKNRALPVPIRNLIKEVKDEEIISETVSKLDFYA